MRHKARLKQYRAGTFDKRVAYGQRTRKLMLVARGVLIGFNVRCESEKNAENLARAFRTRAARIAKIPDLRFGISVKTNGSKVFVTRKLQ